MTLLSIGIVTFFVLQFFTNYCTFGYKILVYSPSISHSHLISCARVADVLARDGHDVTLLEVEFMVPLESNFSKSAKTLRVPGSFFHLGVEEDMDFQRLLTQMSFSPPSAFACYNRYKMLQIQLNIACENFITSQQKLFQKLKAEKFDMIIEEQLNLCGAGLAHLLDIPIHILISSCPMQEHVASLFGLPNPSSFVPSVVDSDTSDKMSLFERFDNLLRQFAGYTYVWDGFEPLTGIFRKHFGNDFPEIRNIVKQSPFVFINVDELIDFPRPIFSNMIYIGGLGMEKTNRNSTLKEPFATEMVKGIEGVVYVSLGSIVRTTDLTERFRRNFLETFGQFTYYHFIVRMEKDDHFSAKIAQHFDNIFLTSWAPQTELLAHPRLKLFITHGGYNSLMEAARYGIPLISLGFFADQYRNGRVAERNGWALPFEKRKLLEDGKEFRETIWEMLTNPKYTLAAKRIQKLIHTKPFSAEERLTKSIRFLEQNGGKMPELQSESRNIGTLALYNLDLAMIFAFFLATLVLSTIWLIRKLIINKIPGPREIMEVKKSKKQ